MYLSVKVGAYLGLAGSDFSPYQHTSERGDIDLALMLTSPGWYKD